MSMPTLDELRAAEVFIQWGFGFIVFGAITMCIGLASIVIVEILNKQNIKYLK